jgi:hypothetical protein
MIQMKTDAAARDADRVRANTGQQLNQKVDEDTRRCIESFAGKSREEITSHLRDLSREWDTERYLQTNASILALTGVLLGSTVSRKFLFIPGVVFGFLFQHGVQGWCPPLPVFRRLGVRTRKEINREKYALKALRGDFNALPQDQQQSE